MPSNFRSSWVKSEDIVIGSAEYSLKPRDTCVTSSIIIQSEKIGRHCGIEFYSWLVQGSCYFWWDLCAFYELWHPDKTIRWARCRTQLMPFNRAKLPQYKKSHDFPGNIKLRRPFQLLILETSILPETHSQADQHFHSFEKARNWIVQFLNLCITVLIWYKTDFTTVSNCQL